MEIGKMEDFTIDQFAGSMALILGSIGGLLMIIWKSRCACKVNCCGLFRCERSPPQMKVRVMEKRINPNRHLNQQKLE